MTCLVLPAMLERQRGVVINVGSFGGELTPPFFGVYSATKVGFSKPLALFVVVVAVVAVVAVVVVVGGGGGGVCVWVFVCVCMCVCVCVCVWCLGLQQK